MVDTPAAPAPADLTAEQIYAMTPAEAGAALAASLRLDPSRARAAVRHRRGRRRSLDRPGR